MLFIILYPLWFSSYLMVTLLLLALIDLFISIPGILSMLFGRYSLAIPKMLEQGEDAEIVLTTQIKSWFPPGCIKIRLKISCEGFISKQSNIIRSESDSRYGIKLDTFHSGVTIYEAKRMWIVSLLGLFCFPVRLKLRVPILILPPPKKPPHTIDLPQGITLRPKPGGGFSDEHDLRPFRFGDTLRSVHWKVSAKLNSLIIREPLTPQSQVRLIHVAKWHGEHERDLILGRLRWISEFLSKWKLSHYVSLDTCGTCAKITRTSELYEYLQVALDNMANRERYLVPVPGGVESVFKIDAAE